MLLAVFIFAGLFVRTDSVAGASCSSLGEWHQLYWYSAILILTAQMSDTVREFFMGEGPGLLDHAGYFLLGRPYAQAAEEVSRDQVGFWTLMPSGTLPSFHPPLSPPRKAISYRLSARHDALLRSPFFSSFVAPFAGPLAPL